jgi:VWFA-related protein
LGVVAALWLGAAAAHTSQDAAPTPAQPTFRAGVNVVRVDVIVTDRRGNPLTSLTRDDFELFEDGKPQLIEQFKLIDAAGGTRRDLPQRELRTRDDELFDAEREDVRVFAILLDDYHVPRSRSMAVRDALTAFIRNHVRPSDLLTVMYPLTPVRTLTFTRDHEGIVQAIRTFEGRKGDYTARNPVEEEHWRNLPAIERIRNDIVVDALSALSIRLGSLREGRKSIILISDGLTAGYQRLRDLNRDANRNNVSIYPFDPCGMSAPQGFSPSGRPECTASRFRRETLQYLADETDGRAIVNRNAFAEGLEQMARDASYYYLLGYNSSHTVNDGKFHEIRVRTKTRGLDVRARKGYWAPTAAEVARAAEARPVVLTPVQRALAAIDIAADAKRYVRTWVGSGLGEGGKTRVTVSWELLPVRDRPAGEQPGRLLLMAADAGGALQFRGEGTVSPGPQQFVFEAAPGRLDLQMAIESAANGETIDRSRLSVEIPDLSAGSTALSTPRVFATRTANDFRVVVGDAAAVPIARREFLRTERLLIRFDAFGASGGLVVTAALVNWTGDRLADVAVSAAEAGGTHQIAFGLGALAPGEYAIEITAAGAGGEAKELVPLRVAN